MYGVIVKGNITPNCFNAVEYYMYFRLIFWTVLLGTEAWIPTVIKGSQKLLTKFTPRPRDFNSFRFPQYRFQEFVPKNVPGAGAAGNVKMPAHIQDLRKRPDISRNPESKQNVPPPAIQETPNNMPKSIFDLRRPPGSYPREWIFYNYIGKWHGWLDVSPDSFIVISILIRLI